MNYYLNYIIQYLIKMARGLTIAFICLGKNHPTITNFNKFGNKYWDDAPNNSSQIGYYFAYYFQQKYVYIHKIIDIFPSSKRPKDMEWGSERQILCLSECLISITWKEWIIKHGMNAPYTPSYHSCQTSSWSYDELKSHTKFSQFNFENLENTIRCFQNRTKRTIILIEDDADKEVKADDEEDEVSVFLKQMEQEDRIRLEERNIKLKEIRERKHQKEIMQLRIDESQHVYVNIIKINKEIDALIKKRDEQIEYKMKIMDGLMDNELIKKTI